MADLIVRVAREALARAEHLVSGWLPHGRKAGKNWVVGNLHGDPGESLVVNLTDGGWKDWSDTGTKGGDLVSLYAAIRGIGQLEAAQALARDLGVAEDHPGRAAPEAAAAAAPIPAKRAADDEWEILNPAPADAPPYQTILTDRHMGDASRHWVYRDAAGLVVLVVVRWDVVKGGVADKVVRPWSCRRHRINGRMQWRQGSVPKPRPILRLDELAKEPAAPVVVCEGEKAADAATTLIPGVITTTSPNGATNAHHADWAALKGRAVLVWPDADETQEEYAAYLATNPPKPRNRDVSGTQYAESVTKLAREAGAARIAWIDRAKLAAALGLKDLPRGYDAADLPAGFVLDLKALAYDLAAPAAPEAPAGAVNGGGSWHQLLIRSLVGYLERRGICPDALDGWRRVRDWELVNDDIAALANDFAYDYRNVDEKISQARVLETLEAYTRRERRARRERLLGTITGKPASSLGDAALRSWVRAMTGKEDELDVAVIRHWLWNAKRMALRMPTEHDLMPVVYGRQGSGKSTGVAMLVRPLAELSLEMDASYLTDDRRSPVLAAAIIGRWEEMQGSQRADLEALKHTITSPTISYRPMRTNQTVVLPRTCSFIGTSNLPVDVMVQDTTGARRFVQLTTPDRCDWSLLAEIDPVAIWESVSEQDKAPILPFLHLLRLHQADLVHKDPFALWLESERWSRLYWQRADSPEPYIVEPYAHERGELFEELAARFAYWCRTVNQGGLGSKSFALRLGQEGFRRKQRRCDGERPWVYFLPSRLLAASASSTGMAGSSPSETGDATNPGW